MKTNKNIKAIVATLLLALAVSEVSAQSPIFRNQRDSGRGDSTTLGSANPPVPSQVLTVYETEHQVCSGVNVVNKYSNGTELVTKANAPECGYMAPDTWNGWLNHWFGW